MDIYAVLLAARLAEAKRMLQASAERAMSVTDTPNTMIRPLSHSAATWPPYCSHDDRYGGAIIMAKVHAIRHADFFAGPAEMSCQDDVTAR